MEKRQNELPLCTTTFHLLSLLFSTFQCGCSVVECHLRKQHSAIAHSSRTSLCCVSGGHITIYKEYRVFWANHNHSTCLMHAFFFSLRSSEFYIVVTKLSDALKVTREGKTESTECWLPRLKLSFKIQTMSYDR